MGTEKKATELTNNEHNEKVFKEIQKLEDSIKDLKLTLKPVERVKYATLAECNAMRQKSKILATKA
tara:strand:- start:282 stop:479 length:198 start_codon:yes stop_codon:yes gene_type:complete